MDFQNDFQDPTKRVLQIDYAQAYQCELQNELWVLSGQEVVLTSSHVQFTIIAKDISFWGKLQRKG